MSVDVVLVNRARPFEQDMWTWPIPSADGFFSHEPSTKVQLKRNIQKQIPVENKSAKLMCCFSVWMQGSVTAVLVNWFASWGQG